MKIILKQPMQSVCTILVSSIYFSIVLSTHAHAHIHLAHSIDFSKNGMEYSSKKIEDNHAIFLDEFRSNKNINFSPSEFAPICAYNDLPQFDSTYRVYPAPSKAEEVLSWMTDQIGISNNFRLLAGKFSEKVGGFAVIRGNHRYIVYDMDENFLPPDRNLTWNTVALFAHELGHHVAGHTSTHNQSNHATELEADYFAGFIMNKLGASLSVAISSASKLYPHDTESHPAASKRAVAYKKGWEHAQKIKRG